MVTLLTVVTCLGAFLILFLGPLGYILSVVGGLGFYMGMFFLGSVFPETLFPLSFCLLLQLLYVYLLASLYQYIKTAKAQNRTSLG